MADTTQASSGLAGRDRVRADSVSGAGYRTFPARLPVLLTALGGVLVVLGALGSGLRASAITRVGDDPTTVRVLTGSGQRTGWVLAAIGVAVAVVSLAWRGRRRLTKLVAVAVAAVAAAAVALRLVSLNDRAALWAAEARRAPRFIGFHAGLGWGAWCLLAGAILAGFGVLVGVLRELDVRKGYAR